MYRFLIRPFLFQLEAEQAHYFAMTAFQDLMKIPGLKTVVQSLHRLEDNRLKTEVAGIQFPNPVGLAAGFDKNGRFLSELALFGFGFIEVGTVTPLPQPGNDKPRLFRLPEDKALINRLGFNNDGMDVLAARLEKKPKGIIVGVNIGKNKTTPNEKAVDDYLRCFERLHSKADYFTVNVSSPNTPGLRALQEKEPLLELLTALQAANKDVQKPIFLKISPDLTIGQLDDILELVETTRISGLVATNTTIERSGLTASTSQIEKIGSGGLSGKPLFQKSTDIVRYLVKTSNGKIPVMAAGGIMTAEDAKQKLDAGAKLVQVYSGFIYGGPGFVKGIKKGLLSE